MSQQWRAVCNTAFDLTDPRFEPKPPAAETNALPLNQLAGPKTCSGKEKNIVGMAVARITIL